MAASDFLQAAVGPGATAMLLSSRNIRCLLALETSGSSQRAASKLGISPEEFKDELSALEKKLDLKLVEGQDIHLQTSDVGRRFVDAFGLFAWDKTYVDYRSIDLVSFKGNICRIAILDELDQNLCSNSIESIRRKFPHVRFEYISLPNAVVEQGLKDGSYDCGIFFERNDVRQGQFSREKRVELVALCAHDHPLSISKCLHLADLIDYPIASMPCGRPSRTIFENACATEEITPKISFVSNCLRELRRTVKMDGYLAVLSNFASDKFHEEIVGVKSMPISLTSDTGYCVKASVSVHTRVADICKELMIGLNELF